MPMQLIDANSGDGASTETTRIVTSRLFDPYTLEFLEDRLITVHSASGVILRVSQVSKDFQASTHDIDLRGLTVLPGFVDSHVHFFLHPYSETSWDDQVLKENLVERTVRAVNHARETLLAGYTAVRDLGTEGAEDADTPLRACISKPKNLTVGPRYFIANRAIVSTGGYGPKSNIHLNRQGVDDRLGAEAADGIEECRKAVRRQIGAGADWIKIYAEYRTKTRNLTSEESLDSYPLFSREELKVMIDTAHSGGVRVAAHVVNEESIITLADLGIDTIEHGQLISDRGLAVLNRTKTIWTPTLMAFESHPNGSIARGPAKRAFQAALEGAVRGDIRISVGGDTGVFSHGKNADEMKVMVRYGAPWRHVLRWATLGGWEAIRPLRWEGSRGSELLQARDAMSDEEVVAAAEAASDNSIPFGVIRRGWAADIIALEGDLDKDFAAAVSPDSVRFVMKAGVVYKQDGRPTFL